LGRCHFRRLVSLSAILCLACESGPAATPSPVGDASSAPDPVTDEIVESDGELQDGIGGELHSDPDTQQEPDALPDLEATGFFRVTRGGGRWWLVTPEGDPFYSIGINALRSRPYIDRQTGRSPYGDAIAEKYDDLDAWAEEVLRRLRAWGFNTIGSWSDIEHFRDDMVYTVILNMSGADWLTGEVPDYFDPAFEERCARIAQEQVLPHTDDPMLLGWFLDNELRWGSDHRSPVPLLDDYLALPEGSPGRLIADEYEGDPDGFLSALAERYFDVSTTAIRAQDPNHLILGVRSISVMTPPAVPAAAADWLDVYTVNHYVFNRGVVATIQAAFAPVMSVEGWLRDYHDVTGLPLLITEFSFRAADSGLSNDWPPIYPEYATQSDRADAFEAYVDSCYSAPYVIGHHWFAWADEPVNGRWDGEDSNFGLVSNDDDPWEELTDRMAEVHARAPDR
jgi:hypothetical protein